MSNISDKAIVGKTAKIGRGVEIGHFAIIEDGVEIGDNVKILPNAYICSGTSIGEGSEIHMGAVIGHLPQDLSFDKSRKTYTRIGKRVIIREHATIHRATKDGGATVVGDDSYLMAVSHVGHDCNLENNVIVANGALLAGHVSVGSYAFVSGNVVIHQFCRIGSVAMIGGFSGINKDVPPFMLVRGPSIIRAINLVGLRRLKIPIEAIKEIRQAYKLIYMSDLNTAQALVELKKLRPLNEIKKLIEFIETSKRGICKTKDTDEEFFE